MKVLSTKIFFSDLHTLNLRTYQENNALSYHSKPRKLPFCDSSRQNNKLSGANKLRQAYFYTLLIAHYPYFVVQPDYFIGFRI